METKSIIILTWLIALVLIEYRYPFILPKNLREKLGHYLKNLSFGGINTIISILLIIPLSKLVSDNSLQIISFDHIIFSILILDLFIYLWHRANHNIAFLWRFHKIHHLDRSLDVTSSVRFHFIEVMISALIRLVVIFLFGISFAHVLIFEAMVFIASSFQHSNINLNKRFEKNLSYLIVTPSIHFIHHEKEMANTNSNYGTIFSFWDRIFGSSNQNIERNQDMDIGLKEMGSGEYLPDLKLLDLLKAPFKK